MPIIQITPVLLGFSAVIGQILFMRELMNDYNVSEVALGVLLAVWLFWTAAGCFLASAITPNLSNPRRAVAALDCLLGISLPLTLWALRASRSLFQTIPGELLGPLPVLLASAACLSAFCAIAGALFVATARMICAESHGDARRAASKTYLLEAFGSATGGIIASLVLLRSLSPFQIATILLAMNLFMAVLLILRMKRKQIATAITAATLLTAFLIVAVAPSIEKQSRSGLWPGSHLLASRDSIYGNLTVIETGKMHSLYENGLLVASAQDESAAEESVHYALLEHPAPKRIMLIGGGANGGLEQALRHPSVERIDVVELNPAIPQMANQYLFSNSAPPDPRVKMHFIDGRAFLNATNESYDVINVSVPDPQTAQLNRFYTVEFFRLAREHLAPDGLLALELRSSEETISPDLAEFLRCIQRTLNEVFPSVVAIPGDTIHFFATLRSGLLTGDPQTLVARLQTRHLPNKYVSQYFIPYRMMPDRMEQARDALQPLASTQINRDFSPIAYYFSAVLWRAQFKPATAGWMRMAARVSFPNLLAGTLVLLLTAAVLLAVALPSRMRNQTASVCSTAAAGFTLMALEIILLLAFQSIYGYLYHQLAVLTALFMAGIATGSWLSLRGIGHNSGSVGRKVAATQLLLALSALTTMLLVNLCTRFSGPRMSWISAQLFFPSLAAFCGVLGGCQFPLAVQLFGGNNRRSLGLLYAVDLVGGCAGALALSGYLIPVFGFWRTAWLTAAVNLAPLLTTLPLCLPSRKLD